MYDLTHASWFSGVGGLDLGLERAGWRTVSFSEIDPYACAVLAERWPGVPNLGSITDVASAEGAGLRLAPSVEHGAGYQHPGPGRRVTSGGADWRTATLWTGGFPCQDLSIAGKRRGLAGERSGLAITFLELVERHRPPWFCLENVPGLLSSNRGRDFTSLQGRIAELGYGLAWRTLDARYFGVAQRRRRVFILATRDPSGRAGAERAAAVLSVAASGGGHPAAGIEAGPGAAGGADDGVARALSASAGHHGHSSPRGDGGDNLVIYNATARFGGSESGDEAGTLSRLDYKSSNHLLVAPTLRGFGHGWQGQHNSQPELLALSGPPHHARGEGGRGQGSAPLGEREPDPRHVADADPVRRASGASPDARRDGAADGLAGRPYHRGLLADEGIVQALDAKGGGPDDNEAQAGHLVVGTLLAPGPEGGRRDKIPHVLAFAQNQRDEVRDVGGLAGAIAGQPGMKQQTFVSFGDQRDYWPLAHPGDDPLLPLGLDSHRYRCCGNGVVSNVARAIGQALADEIAREPAA